jgi:hypothetical protein
MREALHHIRKKYFDAISNNITIDNSTVPIYNRVPSASDTPFIKIYSYLQEEIDQNSTTFINDCITRIEVVTSFFGDNGGEYQLNLIIDGVLDIVRDRTNIDLTSEGFNVYMNTIDKIRYFEDVENEITYFRAIIEIANRVEKI